MIDINVYLSVDDFDHERKLFKKYMARIFGNTDFQNVYGFDFLFCALSSAQYKRLGNTLKDCIVSRRLDDKVVGWSFRVSFILLHVYKIHYMQI